MSTPPWDVIEEAHQGHYAVFDVRRQRARSKLSGQEKDFYIIDSPDWVNIIPLTPDGRKVVFVRQYRQGSETVTLEVPGGVVDPGETPREAALREMTEETGYVAGGEVESLGYVRPNPAIQTNRTHTFLARDVRREREQNLEGAEEIDVVLIDRDEVPRLIREGTISHALVVSAFYLWGARREDGPTPS